jgi:hypothetical protein
VLTVPFERGLKPRTRLRTRSSRPFVGRDGDEDGGGQEDGEMIANLY